MASTAPVARHHCIVTEHCDGVTDPGGLGAHMRALADLLVQAGHDVDLILTGLNLRAKGLFPTRHKLPFRVLCLTDLAETDLLIERPVNPTTKSYALYRHLNASLYDVVHIQDRDGLGFYTTQAKRQNLLSAIIITHALGANCYFRAHEGSHPSLESLEIEALEQRQIADSDHVILLRDGLLEWLTSLKIRTDHCVQRHLLGNVSQENSIAPATLETPAQVHLVFFGEQIRRNGFDRFIEALRMLPENCQPDVSIIGQFGTVFGEHSGGYALRHLTGYSGAIHFYTREYAPNVLSRLAIQASPVAIFPGPVAPAARRLLCSALAIARLETNNLDARTLAKTILNRLNSAAFDASSARYSGAITSDWCRWLETLPNLPASPSEKTPLVSVCLTHFERPKLLLEALDALNAQYYTNFEVIIVDDGSKTIESILILEQLEIESNYKFPLRIIRQENLYLGAARNTAARAAIGEYILLHDDDNRAEPEMLSRFVSAALASGADILTCQAYIFKGEANPERKLLYYPLGMGGAFSFFWNRYGDANALVRKSAFEAIGGFTEYYGIGWEDWEFFLRADLAGYTLSTIPEPLYWYRASNTGMLLNGNPMLNQERFFAMVRELRPALTPDLLRLTLAESNIKQEKARLLAILELEEASDLHLVLQEDAPNAVVSQARFAALAARLGRPNIASQFGGIQQTEARASLNLTKAETPLARLDNAKPAILLTGWWKDTVGNFPKSVSIGGKTHSCLSVIRTYRPDVIRALGASQALDFGFCVLALPMERSPYSIRGLLKRQVKMGRDRSIASGLEITFSCQFFSRGGGQIDALASLSACEPLQIETACHGLLRSEGNLHGVALQGNRLVLPERIAGGMALRFALEPGVVQFYLGTDTISPRLAFISCH